MILFDLKPINLFDNEKLLHVNILFNVLYVIYTLVLLNVLM